VAGHGAGGRPARSALLPPQDLSPEWAHGGAHRAPGHRARLDPAFTKAVYTAEFGEGRDIADPAVLTDILTELGLEAGTILAEAQTDANKMRLRRMGDDVQSRGIFGAPTFFTEDGEMFWGNDRLEQALDWAVAQARRSDWPV
jgi:2-hydroxychromene-2-carboxylate isomerase